MEVSLGQSQHNRFSGLELATQLLSYAIVDLKRESNP